MITFIIKNLATILISTMLLVIVACILISFTKKKKRGESFGCGCGCQGCPNAFLCHKH